jgi:serine protease Do
MVTPALDLCPSCGQQSASDVACTRCGSNLRVDLWLEGPVADERKRFFAARELAALALPGLGFSELKQGLAVTTAPLAVGLARSSARLAIEVLGRHGVQAIAKPTAAAPGGRRSRMGLTVLGGSLLALAAAGLLLWTRRPERTEGVAAPSSLAMGRAGASSGPTGASDQRAPGAGPGVASPGRLTTQEISSRALESVAEVSCQGRLGTAFFVRPDRAVTNAHVACAGDERIRMRLKDGREFASRTVTWEKRRDLAVIEVPGATVKPLEVGDSTTLAPGDPLVLVGNPMGLDFTVHEARVSSVGRNLLGNAYVQVNGDVNPGNSGGPLLNGRGEVVGIVSMKVTGAEGIGLALPIEYARSFVAGLAPPPPEAAARWQATLDRVRGEDAADVEKYRAKFQRPALAAVGFGESGGFGAVVLRRWPGGPGALSVTVDVRVDDKTVCSSEGTIREWTKVEQGLEKALRDSPDQPRLVWASENHVMRDVFAGSFPLDLGRCKLDDVPASAALVIRGGEESEAPIRLPRGSAEAMRLAEAERRARLDAEAARTAHDEASWREAFQRIRSTLTSLEARRAELKVNVADSTPTTGSQDPRRQLAEIEAQLARTREALEELERQASSAGIPRAWRE